MEYRLAQKRLLFCAALFSFGTLSGFITLINASAGSEEWLAACFFAALHRHPYMLAAGIAIAGPLLLIVFGLSPTGAIFVSFFVLIFGVAVGAAIGLAFRAGVLSLLPACFSIPYAFCLILLAGYMLRISALMRVQLRAAGRIRPDYGSDLPRILAALLILVLISVCFALYLTGH